MLKMVEDEKVLARYTSNTIEDLFIIIAQKKVQPSAITDFLGLKRLTDEEALSNYIKKNTSNKETKYSKQAILVNGASNVKISVSTCCSPLPGEEIIGYVSRGQGVKVHRLDCPNMKDE
jgi:GTP pyrophosphokinase